MGSILCEILCHNAESQCVIIVLMGLQCVHKMPVVYAKICNLKKLSWLTERPSKNLSRIFYLWSCEKLLILVVEQNSRRTEQHQQQQPVPCTSFSPVKYLQPAPVFRIVVHTQCKFLRKQWQFDFLKLFLIRSFFATFPQVNPVRTNPLPKWPWATQMSRSRWVATSPDSGAALLRNSLPTREGNRLRWINSWKRFLLLGWDDENFSS